MLNAFMSSLNWIDILMVGIMMRAIFVGMKTGFFIELFKLLSIVFAIFITHHYYTFFAWFLGEKAHFAPFLANSVGFGFLWILVVLIFKLVRDALLILFKMQANSAFDQWAGFAIALGRGALICSLTFMLLYVSEIKELAKYLNRSLSGPYLSNLSLGVYEACYYSLVSKFFEHEQLNSAVFKLRDIEAQK